MTVRGSAFHSLLSACVCLAALWTGGVALGQSEPMAEEPAAEAAPAESAPAQPAQLEPAAPPAGAAAQTAPPSEPSAAAEGAAEAKTPGGRGYSDFANLLEDAGVGPSYFRLLLDGEPISSEEREALLRLVYTVAKRMKAIEIESFARPWSEAALEPDSSEARGHVFKVEGTVTEIERLEPLPEIAERFELPEYYRCRIEKDAEKGDDYLVYTTSIPKAWKEKLDGGEAIDERASALGVLFKLGENRDAILVARRVAWHPKTLLGDLGMDYGLFDDVLLRSSLTGRENDAFYSMLAAAGRSKKLELLRHTEGKPDDVIPLLQEPREFQGELLCLVGTARRAVEVRIDDPEIIQRYGIDHYWQLEMTIELDHPVRIMPRKEVRSRYPAIFCVLELPDEFPRGAAINEGVRVPGFFMKMWGYQTNESIDAGDDEPSRAAPLFFGRTFHWIRPESNDRTYIAILAGGLFSLTAAMIWLWLWLDSRKDTQFQKDQLSRAWAPAGGASGLNELAFDEYGGPTFKDVEHRDGPPADEEPKFDFASGPEPERKEEGA